MKTIVWQMVSHRVEILVQYFEYAFIVQYFYAQVPCMIIVPTVSDDTWFNMSEY